MSDTKIQIGLYVLIYSQLSRRSNDPASLALNAALTHMTLPGVAYHNHNLQWRYFIDINTVHVLRHSDRLDINCTVWAFYFRDKVCIGLAARIIIIRVNNWELVNALCNLIITLSKLLFGFYDWTPCWRFHWDCYCWWYIAAKLWLVIIECNVPFVFISCQLYYHCFALIIKYLPRTCSPHGVEARIFYLFKYILQNWGNY